MTEMHAATAVRLAPFLSVRRGAQAVDFYKKAFGATELFRIEGGGGSVVAQLAVGGKQTWPVREENGWNIGRLLDPFGHHWEIGKPLSASVGA